MDTVHIIYWTQTGNTLAMAEAIGKGVEEAGGKAYVTHVSSASTDELKTAAAFAIGCPAMGAEVLEESEMEPFVEALEGDVSGKVIALFGSYGWGDGEWMRDWETRMSAAGAKVLGGAGLICKEMPDEDAIQECMALGAKLAKA